MELTEHLSPKSVLLVDDEPDLVNEARRVLEGAGFAVVAAGSGEAALGFIEHERPQLVITDVSLPDRTGIEVLTAIRGTYPDMPVIMITAQGQLSEAREALRQGAFHFIQKPWAPEDLVTICLRAIETIVLRVENARLKQATSAATLGVSERVRFSPRPERAAMERAALVRVAQFMGDAITKASTRVLEQALGEPASDEALADVLGEAFVRNATGGEWAAALLRGAQVQRELLQQAGGGLSARQVGDFLGISRAAVDKRRRQGGLLGLKLPSGDFVYPAAQFVKNDVVRGLSDVLSAFHVEDPWMQLDALLARDEALGGRTAFEALAQGDVERVTSAVSSFGEQGL
jgi:FixJ family two-component response regulator/biotin operon repressor